jgi:hypothetical protein
MVTVTVALTFPSNGAITITVDPEPVPLGSSGDRDIEWILDDTTYGLGWRFASRGVEVKAPKTVFKNKHGSGNGKKHGWKSLTHDNQTYKYSINLENPDTEDQLTWDPTIMN